MCSSDLVRASELARQGVENLYADPWWYGSNGLPPLPAGAPNPWRPFDLDNFSYPPPFLLIVAPLGILDGDFLAQRALWFGVNGLVAAAGLWLLARWIDGPRAHRVLLLAPIFFGTLPVLLTLQIGNFHLVAAVLAVPARVAVARGRAVRGGALLALTTLAKISPGILGVGLVVRRAWREIAIVAGFAALLLGLSVVCFGTDPLRSFVTFALPRLSAGTAFPFMETQAGIVTNMSPFGLPFKLHFLGFDVGDPWQIGPWVARLYTLGLLGVAFAPLAERGTVATRRCAGWRSWSSRRCRARSAPRTRPSRSSGRPPSSRSRFVARGTPSR